MKTSFITSLQKIHPRLELISEYRNTRTKIIVKDDLNIYYSVFPLNLLSGNFPSIQSSLDKNDAFQKILKSKNLDYTLLDDYINAHTPIKVRDSKGFIFILKPTKLTEGVKPNNNSALNYYEQIINQCNIIHNNEYKYNLININNSKSKLKIICKEHGLFEQRLDCHLKGSKCPLCSKSKQPSFTFNKWIYLASKSNNFNSYKVYLLKLFNENEVFYKIGRTFTTVNNRFKNNPYNIEIIKEFISEDSKYLYDLENYLHRLHKPYKYKPKSKFGGWTECYSEIIIN